MADISSEQRLRQWLCGECALSLQHMEKLAPVLSRRAYYRITTDNKTFIVTDAAEDPSSIAQFPVTASLLQQAGLYTPKLHCVDLERGYLLQEDLGGEHWFDQMQLSGIAADYQQVLADLYKLQSSSLGVSSEQLPEFDWQNYCHRAERGMVYFLQHELGQPVPQTMLHSIEALAISAIEILQQNTSVLCHRDFHSRNIMMTPSKQLAHIDFQMLCTGPMAYDLASILRDAYVRLEDQEMMQLLRWYYCKCQDHDSLPDINWPEFLLWFDAATLLRHMRCIGLFCRNSNQPLYRNALNNALYYLRTLAQREPLFEALLRLLPAEA